MAPILLACIDLCWFENGTQCYIVNLKNQYGGVGDLTYCNVTTQWQFYMLLFQ